MIHKAMNLGGSKPAKRPDYAVQRVIRLLVGCHNNRTIFIETVDQLEQVVSGLPGHRQITELINDLQVTLVQ